MAKMAKWRRHTVEFKRQVVERMKTCENIGALARELKLQRKLLYTWKYQFEGRPEPRHANLGTTAEDRKEKQLRDEITKLKSALADKTLETIFFEVPCSRSRRDASRVPRLAPQHLRRHPVAGARARHVRRGTDVPSGGVSRASYYRHWEEVAPDEAEMAARVAIQEVVLRHRRRYGYRRVTEDLHRQGMVINHKRVARIMREDNLLAIRYRKYILTTIRSMTARCI
jgi:transposase-like protein